MYLTGSPCIYFSLSLSLFVCYGSTSWQWPHPWTLRARQKEQTKWKRWPCSWGAKDNVSIATGLKRVSSSSVEHCRRIKCYAGGTVEPVDRVTLYLLGFNNTCCGYGLAGSGDLRQLEEPAAFSGFFRDLAWLKFTGRCSIRETRSTRRKITSVIT